MVDYRNGRIKNSVCWSYIEFKNRNPAASELKDVDKIEKSINDMQAHIKFLLKRETENKNLGTFIMCICQSCRKGRLVIAEVVAEVEFILILDAGKNVEKRYPEQ